MEYSEIIQDNRTVLSFGGSITVREAEELKHHFMDAVSTKTHLHLDFTGITQMDVCIIQLLVSLHSRISDPAGMSIADSQDHIVAATFQKAGLSPAGNWWHNTATHSSQKR